MAAANPIVLPGGKQPLKSLTRSPKFLRHGYNVKGNAAKRKSAVELLQESKAFYVKSEQVLDSKQELKHTEHLQVTSNPSYDSLLRHPTIRTTTSTTTGGGGQQQQYVSNVGHDSVDPAAAMMMAMTMTTSPGASGRCSSAILDNTINNHHHHYQQQQHQLHQAVQHRPSASHGVESKLMTVTLLGSARLHNHVTNKSAVDNNSPGRNGRATIARVSTSSASAPAAGGGGSASTMQHQHQLVDASATTTPSSSRSPRSPHIRAKTQPESSACPPSSTATSTSFSFSPLTPQYRRSLSERDNASFLASSSDDVQMKLRRLLNTDSKENLQTINGGAVATFSSVGHHRPRPVQAADAAIASPVVVVPDVVVDSSAFIKPRHQQEGNYCIHKSMPDLSPLQLGQGTQHNHQQNQNNQNQQCQQRRRRSDGSNDSMSVKAPKSADLKPAPNCWTTSDHVSRSPASTSARHHDHQHHPAPTCFTFNPADRARPNMMMGYAADHDQLVVTAKEQLISSRSRLLRGERVPVDEGDDDEEDDDGDSTNAEVIGNLVTQGARRRPIFRSKSDISHRYSKSGTDLSSTGSPSKRNSRCGAELERFFDTMGLDSSVLYVLNTPPSDQCSSPVFFASVSSSPSSNNSLAAGHQCCCNGAAANSEVNGGDIHHHHHQHGLMMSSSKLALACQNVDAVDAAAAGQQMMLMMSKDGLNNASLVQHGPVETSIVERNARVIKWLFNCRKMSQGDGRSATIKSSPSSSSSTSVMAGWSTKHQDP